MLTEDQANLLRLTENVARFLDMAGSEGECRGCGRKIWWITNGSGRKAPYTHELLNHFVDCVQRDKFRKDNDEK